MDFRDTPLEAGFRKEAQFWLKENAPAFELPDRDLQEAELVEAGRRWQRRLSEGGYAGVSLPRSLGGRGASLLEAMVFDEEESRFRLPKGPYVSIGTGMAIPVIGKHGNEKQISRFVEATLRGDILWCQLFSEPAAGSDLAALRTSAVRQGDEWVINGQKVWSSWAHHSDWGILVARTDPAVPKHKGLTFFVVDMKTPGIETRVIRQMSGDSDFNETFLTDVRVPDDCRIGNIGEGWACCMTTLMGERLASGGDKERGVRELIDFARSLSDGGSTALDNDAIRLELAKLYAEERAAYYLLARMRTMLARGDSPGAMSGIIKLTYANRLQRSNGLAMELSECRGITRASDDKVTAQIWKDYIWSAAMRIAGGADEVLRNQIAERVLGMPGEVRMDKNTPFNEL